MLCHVRDLVCQHRGQFRFALCGLDRPGIHADVAPRQGERVQRGVLDQEKLERLVRVLAAGDQAAAELEDLPAHYAALAQSVA